ncbi:MAG: nickel pincer cofactor biosynthesis protein LarC [Deltaproteobacteria bacterium]|nr:nickel pincer cofactor biosynthesis protein LarC [Deltaproteobacteria bacterium]
MKIAYFDCFSGASGDMILGALLDAGLPLEYLKQELAKLSLSHYDLQVRKVVKNGLSGSQALVAIDQDHHHHHHRHLADIQAIIEGSGLDPAVQEDSVKIFTRLAEAEARVHRTEVGAIHFHEVGAMDAIIDVVGAVIGLRGLGLEKIYCSPFHVGTGTVECAHGTLPVPAPATAELITGLPAYATGVQGELLTPTGAAILTTLAAEFGPLPAMTVERVGLGAGAADRSLANLLRLFIGQTASEAGAYEVEQTAVIETTIDDMNPQIYDFLIERVLQMGALDIFFTSVQMKKNRTGVLVTILCRLEQLAGLVDFIFRETTTIGLRWRLDQRFRLQRNIQEVSTRFGRVQCKVARLDGRTVNIAPEYEDCKRIAREQSVPLKKIWEEAQFQAAEMDRREAIAEKGSLNH